MDIKTKERILNTLLINADPYLDRPVEKLLEQLPDLNKNVIEATLFNLFEDGFLVISKTSKDVLRGSINNLPSGTVYYDRQNDYNAAPTVKEQLSDIYSQVEITPKAIGYLRKLKEDKDNAIRKKWDDRQWNIIQRLITGAVGFILGYLAYWLKIK